ncbi:MAG: hypothetical protein K2N56_09255 [Oscillospiraceae bacterium]|nr:hypothetical protein [Oscillospiraceae bacterium]
MKTSEQMTHEVLVRRDKELKEKAAKRRRAMRIGVPCAAALALTVVCSADMAARGRGSYINNVIAGPESGTSGAEVMVSGPEIYYPDNNILQGFISSTNSLGVAEPETIDFTNPKAGQNDIHVISVTSFNADNGVKGDPLDLDPYTMDQLYSFYRIEFDRLTKLHSDWALQHEPLGIYKKYSDDGFAASMSMYCTRNTLNYTTDTGAKVTVSAQLNRFDPLSAEKFAKDKPFTPTLSEPTNFYDENGNLIGQGTGSYNPDNDPNLPVNDEGVSLVNGYDAYIYRDSSGDFAADINMNTRVRITAAGLSEAEFLKILDEYTA